MICVLALVVMFEATEEVAEPHSAPALAAFCVAIRPYVPKPKSSAPTKAMTSHGSISPTSTAAWPRLEPKENPEPRRVVTFIPRPIIGAPGPRHQIPVG